MASTPKYTSATLENIYRSLMLYLNDHTEYDEASASKTLAQMFPGLKILRLSQQDPTKPNPEETLAAAGTPLVAFRHIAMGREREHTYGGSYVAPRLWVLHLFVGPGDGSRSLEEKLIQAEDWLSRAFRHATELYVYSFTYGTTGVRGKSDDDIGTFRVLNPRIVPRDYSVMAQGGTGWLEMTFEGSIRLFAPD